MEAAPRSGIVKEVLNTPDDAHSGFTGERSALDIGRGDCRRADQKIKRERAVAAIRRPGAAPSGRSSGSSTPLSLHAADASRRSRVEFNRDIRPILSENCYACHGPDKNKRKAKLRLDDRASAVSIQAIVPGKPDESGLVERMLSDDAEQVMPPPASHKTLTPAQKDLLKRWIAQGAEYQAHWAYVPPERHPVPTVEAGVVGPQPHRRVHPQHARIQGHRTLARGRPADPDPPALARPDRPAADARGGPRVRARHRPPRLRAAGRPAPRVAPLRRADGRSLAGPGAVLRHGRLPRRPGPAHLPVPRLRDRRVQPQRALRPVHDRAARRRPASPPDHRAARGDRLQPPEHDDPRGGAQPGEYLAKYASDRVRTVSNTWLGSTMGCCECHDHKYDPFTSRDFYSLVRLLRRRQAVGRLPGLRLHPQPRAQGLEQRPSVPSRDRSGQPLPEAPTGTARGEDPSDLLARGLPVGRRC